MSATPKRRSGRAGDQVIERIVMGAYRSLTGREGSPMRYAMLEDTPVGLLGLATTERGLARVDFVKDEDEFILRLLRRFGERPVLRGGKGGALDEPRRELERYFKGRELRFDLPVDLTFMSPFERRVLEVTAKIPAGHVKTYSEVAARAGRPRAVRAAGNAVGHNPVAIVVPCHRVVRTDGSLGGYGGGIHIKEWLLEHEGVLPERFR
jgi:methylated-DNA-[protein]-cysteine S-methyltransferase